MRTIEPKIQEAILDLLPDDGELALCLMYQLLANMIMSIKGTHSQAVMDLIKVNLDAYERAES